jgi:O-antigen/teichoic acid export membrane protein
MAASGMALNILLNVYLIPRFFAIGSSFASFSTQFATSLIQVILVQRIFRFKPNYRFLFSLFIFVTGVIGIGFVSKQFGFSWTINLLCMVALCGSLAMVLRIINFREMFKIIKNG